PSPCERLFFPVARRYARALFLGSARAIACCLTRLASNSLFSIYAQKDHPGRRRMEYARARGLPDPIPPAARMEWARLARSAVACAERTTIFRPRCFHFCVRPVVWLL